MDDLFVKPLPTSLLNRYKGWKATQFEENKVWYKRLADEGQKPRAMIISCCDSRVHATSIFGADMGEFFIHRNIANLVPPFKADMEYHGTSAAVEYAIKNLKIPHLIVLGHSNCGGIKGGYEQSQKNNKNNILEKSFVSQWLKILEPAIKNLKEGTTKEIAISELEKTAILVSISNLLTFPFVKDSIEDGSLSLHALWQNIATGSLEQYNSGTNFFEKVE